MTTIILFIIPLLIIELGLLIFALVDLIKRENVTGGNKILWAILIVFVEIIGPILYLALGRKEKPLDGD